MFYFTELCYWRKPVDMKRPLWGITRLLSIDRRWSVSLFDFVCRCGITVMVDGGVLSSCDCIWCTLCEFRPYPMHIMWDQTISDACFVSSEYVWCTLCEFRLYQVHVMWGQTISGTRYVSSDHIWRMLCEFRLHLMHIMWAQTISDAHYVSSDHIWWTLCELKIQIWWYFPSEIPP